MHNNNASAAQVADKFKVSELEPRLENIWSGVETPGPDTNPGGPDGQGPQPGNQ